MPSPEINTSLTVYSKNNTNHQFLRSKYNEMVSYYDGHTAMFTDASKTEAAVGSAVIYNKQRYTLKLPKHCSVYTGELTNTHERL